MMDAQEAAEELERFKTEISLAEVASAYGYQLDGKESSRASLVMRRLADNDKIVIGHEGGHDVFFGVRNEQQNGSVIDFVMRQEGISLGRARQVLRKWLDSPAAFFPGESGRRYGNLKPEPVPKDCTAIHARWLRMRPYNGTFCRNYLEKERGLSADTIRQFSERIRIDGRGNVVFRHDDLHNVTGWEVKNRNHFTGFAGSGNKALFGVKVGYPQKEQAPLIVVAESAIDAMSYYQLHPAPGFYLSFGGNMSPEQPALLEYVLHRYPAARIIAATDNDREGEKYAELIQSIRPDAIRDSPNDVKDWNEAVKNRSRASVTSAVERLGKARLAAREFERG
jgi:hypothetical protein